MTLHVDDWEGQAVDMHVQIELFGGPEDGREITIPLAAEGAPVSPLPVPSPQGAAEIEDPTDAVAWYERHHRNRRGVWIYQYANVLSKQHTETH